MSASPTTDGRAQALFRIAPVRYLVAELIPFGCVFLCILLTWAYKPVGAPVGAIIELIGGSVGTIYYLYKVLGSSAGWAIPFLLLVLASTYLTFTVMGDYRLYDNAHSQGTPVLATGADWLAWGSALGTIAVMTALAAATGERWSRRHQPRDRLDAISRVRGGLAWLWLPSYWPQEPAASRTTRMLTLLFSLLGR